MADRLGLGVGVLAALLPWTVLGWRHAIDPHQTFLVGPAFVFTAVGLGLVGVGLAAVDRWLGCFVLYTAAAALLTQRDLGLAIAHWIALGAIGLVLVRHAAPRWLCAGLIVSGIAQTVLMVGQIGGHDPFWDNAMPFAHGTFGNSKHLGAFLAVVTPLAPLRWAWVLILGVILSRSWLAAGAVAAGLLVRPGMALRWRLYAGLAGLLAIAGVTVTRGAWMETLYTRTHVWSLAWRDTPALGWLTGHGPGGWYTRMLEVQVSAAGPAGPAEVFTRAHSDLVQLGYEGGVVALALLAAWLYTHRRALWASPWRGAALAVGIQALAFYPWHLPTVAPAAIVVLGLATRPERA
jgi:hypothetical protein